jgi:hypothetical protein
MYCSIEPSKRIIQPSIIYFCEGLLKAISSHPLISSGHIFHPITNEVVNISSYRFMNGVEIGDGLICSIFPSYESFQESPPSPLSSKTSIVHKDYSLGTREREDMYNIVIKLTYKDTNIDYAELIEDKNLIEVPIYLNEPYDTTSSKAVIEVYSNPALSIISEYLEIIKIIISSHYWLKSFFDYSDLFLFHTNYNSIEWSANANAYFNNGHVMLGIKTHVNVGWEDKYNLPIRDINLEVNDETTGHIL